MNDFPKTMRAAVLTELRKPLVISEISLPQTLKPGHVLVQIHYSGICGSQLGEIDGAKGEDRFLPHLLGHEASATVLAIGPGVNHVHPDDKVVLHWRKGLGIESEPPHYTWEHGRVNAGWVTSFNEYAVVSENRCTVVPPECSLKVAALYGCAVTTGFGVVENNAKVKIGESVVVYGAGGVGLNVIQAASLRSAYPVIAVDLYDNRLKLAQEMGATHLINASYQNPEEFIQRAVTGQGVDVFIDNTGLPKIIEMGYKNTKPQGRVILVGVPKKGMDANIFTLPLHFGKVLSGSHGGECLPHVDIPRIDTLQRLGRISFDGLITSVVGLDQINGAIKSMKDGTLSGRCLIDMSI